MNAVLMVVVTAVVLLMTALTLIFITQGGLSNFLQTAQEGGGKGVCTSKRDTFCTNNPNEVWRASSFEYQGKTCDEFLGYEVYSCEEESSAAGKGGGMTPSKDGEGCVNFCDSLKDVEIADLDKAVQACDSIEDNTKFSNNVEQKDDPVKYVEDNKGDIPDATNCECSDKVVSCYNAYWAYAYQTKY